MVLGAFDRSPASATPARAWMFVGGLFIGFGTRLANGCTSHGIFGLSTRVASLPTACFMAGGILTTQAIHRLGIASWLS